MSIFSRYLIRSYFRHLGVLLAALLFLVLLSSVLGKLGGLVSHPLRTFWEVAFTLPFSLAIVLQLSVLLAAAWTWIHLQRTLELTAWRAAGLGPWSLLRPLLLCQLPVLLLVYANQHHLRPWIEGEISKMPAIRSILRQAQPENEPRWAVLQYPADDLVPGAAVDSAAVDGAVVDGAAADPPAEALGGSASAQRFVLAHAAEVTDQSRQLKALYLITPSADAGGLAALRYASKAQRDEDGWHLEGVVDARWKPEVAEPLRWHQVPEAVQVASPAFPVFTAISADELHVMPPRKLLRRWHARRSLGGEGTAQRRLDLLALLQKVAALLLPFVMLLLSLVLWRRTPRQQGYARPLTTAFVLGTLALALTEILLRLGRAGEVTPYVAAFGAHALFFALGVFFLQVQRRPRRTH